MKTSEEYEAEIRELRASFEATIVQIEEGQAAYEKHIRDLERSAASAREIARVAMSHTGTRAIRVSIENTGDKIQLIVCDPAGDERQTCQRIAQLLDASILAAAGFALGSEHEPIGSSE